MVNLIAFQSFGSAKLPFMINFNHG